jgi:hypothetical protein
VACNIFEKAEKQAMMSWMNKKDITNTSSPYLDKKKYITGSFRNHLQKS